MTIEKDLVEVAVRTEDGLKPLGIMNIEQAQALPDEIDVVVMDTDDKTVRLDTSAELNELAQDPTL